jgi:hypothetical protein
VGGNDGVGFFEADSGLEAEGLLEHGGGNFWFTVAVADDASRHHIGIAERVAIVNGEQLSLVGDKQCVLTIVDERCDSAAGDEIAVLANGYPLEVLNGGTNVSRWSLQVFRVCCRRRRRNDGELGRR